MTSVAFEPRPETVERLLDIVAKEGMVDRGALAMDAPLEAVGVKSADVVMILIAIEEEFGVYISVDSELSEIRTVGELIRTVAARVEKGA